MKVAYLKIALFAVLAIAGIASISYSTYHMGFSEGYVLKESELKECAEEVSLGCPNVTTYAVMLEKENARLNRKCKRKTQKGLD